MPVDITEGMPVFELISPMPVSAEALYAWHARPGAFRRLVPPWDDVRVVSERGPFESREVELAMKVGPARVRWVARHEAVVPGRSFRDVQVHGPFARWEHTHLFEPTETGSRLVDRVDYALPLGSIGDGVGGDAVDARLRKVFAFRHRRTREDLELHAGRAPLHFAVTGASGLVGTELCALLESGGHTVVRLVRRAAGPGEARWDPAAGTVDLAALEGVDVVVHLAGENVGERWTDARRKAILESRKLGTATIARAVATLKPRAFLSCSATGFYGDRGDAPLDETASSGEGFLADVCRAWEAAVAPAEAAGVRTVRMRVGVVLAARGGALAKLVPPYLAGAGGPVGSGRQQMSWIALDDLLRAIVHLAFADGVAGPVNMTAPAPVAQAEFAKVLGAVLHRPAILPLPAFAVRAMFGEMGREVLLAGQRVLPTRLQGSGFHFVRTDLREALAFELGR